VTAIELAGVHKRYEIGSGEVHALRGVDLAIARGEYVSVMGPSGSGKSTLLEILGCLSRPSAGRYWLHGTAVDEVDADGLARLRGETIGFVFQAFNLLPRLTLLENVALPLLYRRVPRRARHERALGALARVSLEHRAAHRPGEVSGGERQRAAIARALVNRPSLLLADEPTGNLDSAHGREILALLEGIHADGATVVIVTHDASIGARTARRIAIRDGAIESDSKGLPLGDGAAQRAEGERRGRPA
jgi:putative ABC transport system ATP-binding protein